MRWDEVSSEGSVVDADPTGQFGDMKNHEGHENVEEEVEKTGSGILSSSH